MTPVEEVRYLLDLLGPSLEDTGRWCCAIQDGQLAVCILREPAHVTRTEFLAALWLHGQLPESGLLIVL